MEQDTRFHDLLAEATAGRISRRAVLKRAAALGLSAPAIAALLAACGGGGGGETPTSGTGQQTATSTSGTGQASPTASATTEASPTSETGGTAGGGGELRLLWWQAPSILNAHLSSGTKDFDATRVVLEPLADFDKDSKLVPQLAAEIPSRENGGVAEDGKSVTWKLKQGVKWHDGEEFTSADVKFTYDYVINQDTGATTYGSYAGIESVETPDEYTVVVHFKQPTPDWFTPFTGPNGMILPEHVLKDFVGTNARNAEFNLKPVGTGAYQVVDFKPNDVGTFKLFPDYWDKGKPHFDTITMKGGGDAASAARAVLQTGEADYAWNIQVEPAVLNSMEQGSSMGHVQAWSGGGTERLMFNHSDPQTETNGERSFYQNPHPHFKVKEVRNALALLVQRDVIAQTLYGKGGEATALTLNNNPPYMPDDLTWEFNVDKAKQLLDQAGATPGPDGIRELNGRKLHWVYQTSVNPVRQKTQELVKEAAAQAGIEIEIKAVVADVYFSGDPGNPDELGHFYADLQMFTNSADIFPVLWYRRYVSVDPARDICQKANQWSADNSMRYQNAEFNDMWKQVSQELDPDKATQLFLDMQRLVINDFADMGVVARNNVACVSNKIKGNTPTQWASDLWDLKNWTTS